MHEIKCPYCYERFAQDEVWFRLTHSAEPTREDVPKTSSGGKSTDECLRRYFASISSVESAERFMPVRCESEFVGKVNSSDDGVVSSIVDIFGEKSSERICPYCHNTLPPFAGHYENLIFAVIGETSVGKTVYLEALAASLMSGIGFARNAGTTVTAADKATQDWYKTAYISMFQNCMLPMATNRARQEPIHMMVDNGNRKTVISLYDAAGEGLRTFEDRKRYLKHLRYADAFIVLVDPVETSLGFSIRDAMGRRSFQSDEQTAVNNIAWLLPDMTVCGDLDGKSKPAAIVLAKSDLVRVVAEFGGHVSRDSRIFSKACHEQFLNLDEIQTVSAETMRLMRNVAPDLCTCFGAVFQDYSYFTVSSLGFQPAAASAQGKMAHAPVPVRAEEPFLWLLMKEGIIEGSYPTSIRRCFHGRRTGRGGKQ